MNVVLNSQRPVSGVFHQATSSTCFIGIQRATKIQPFLTVNSDPFSFYAHHTSYNLRSSHSRRNYIKNI